MIDFIIALMLAFGAWRGFKVGATRVLLSLIGYVFAIIAAMRLYNEAAPFFAGVSSYAFVQNSLGFVAVALVVVLISEVLIYVFRRALKVFKLTIIDKLMGSALGFLRAMMKILLILNASAPILALSPSTVQNSMALKALAPFAPVASKNFMGAMKAAKALTH